jgi:hypothetical protein
VAIEAYGVSEGPEEVDSVEIELRELMESEDGMEGGFEFGTDDTEESPSSPDTMPGVSIEQLRSIVKHQIEDSVNYADEDLASRRIARQEAYEGDPLDTDALLDDTRSRVISKDVHDTVHAILPSIMRIFTGGPSPVEYLPTGIEDVPMAEQATDYVNDIVLYQDNDFFTVMYDAAHDALVKGIGVFKWWWDESTSVDGSYYSGLDQTAFQLLASDPESVVDDYEEIPGPMGEPTISCHVTRTVVTGGKVTLNAVPPEERLISRDARTIAEAYFYGHRREVSVSEMVALGFSYPQIVNMSGSADSELDTNAEAVERYDNQAPENTSGTTSDPSLRELEVVEGYFRVDLDGDGIAEMYRIYAGGNAWQILEWDDGDLAIDLCDEVPFAEICPDPVPHNATGKAVSDQVMDIQHVKTNLLRGSLDSLSRSIFPREEVVETAVNIDDVLNPEIGAIIRTKAPGMVREIVTPFMGKECLPLLGYMDEVKAERTGISDATMGLNPQTLQSSTQGAVDNAVSAAQTQIELIARHFSNGVRKMFVGILQTIKQNQDQVRTVRLRNQWVPVDPRAWDAGMDAKPAVALGRGTEQDRVQYLMMIAGKQEQIMQQLGPQNGLVTLAEYRNTMEGLVQASGYFHADQFFLPVQLGEQVQQLKGQLDEQTQKNQQLEQKAALMQSELLKRSASSANKDDAAAEKSRADAFGSTVSAVHEAGEAIVEGAQVLDELALNKVITAKPNPQGPQG